ncbi:hypothetical protein [Luteipulveratus halotolerans]|uniref:DUF732 domain-containing protein n=1 Tax=Luteipulveratus halotolerans TaxID=1631356 RepID=A0A0L6CEK1_9MICO|nr:hypothetical protein [Luteipulveratus halotolerans]KNX36109.1 hypothetical protein VV01_01410 [Luteipulveratus halotolerans]
MHTIMRRTAALALAATIPFGLAACGGGDKPSKGEVKAGYAKVASSRVGASAQNPEFKKSMDKFTGCIVDKTYDDLSADTLNAIKDGDTDADISKDDEKKIDKATNECKSTLTP